MEDNIKMGLKELDWEGAECIDLAQDMDKWRAGVNAVMNLNLTFMEPRIARCVFYITNEMQLIQCSLLSSALYIFRGYFRPSSGAYKTVCAAFMLSCCLPLVWMGWNSSNPSTPAVDSRKAWQYPRLHIQFYKLLMMGGNTARNM